MSEAVLTLPRFLGEIRHVQVFALGIVGCNEGAYVHDELGPLMEAAVVAGNEHGRAVPGRVYELHIVGRFLAPMARMDERGACRGR